MNLVEFYDSDPEKSSKELVKELQKASSQPINKQKEDHLNYLEDLKEFSKHDVKEWDNLENDTKEYELKEYPKVKTIGKKEEEEIENKMVKGLKDGSEGEEQMLYSTAEPNGKEVEELEDF